MSLTVWHAILCCVVFNLRSRMQLLNSSSLTFFINKVHYVRTPIYGIVASCGTPVPKTNGTSELSGRSYSRRRMFTSWTFAYSPGRDHFPLSLSLVSFNIAVLFGQRRPRR